MKTRLSLICCLLFWATTHNFAQNSTTFSLNQLLDSALQNNYLLHVNEKNALIKQSDIEILKTNYQPTIGNINATDRKPAIFIRLYFSL